MRHYMLTRDCNGRAEISASAYLAKIEQAMDAAAARQERANLLEAIRGPRQHLAGMIPWASTGDRPVGAVSHRRNNVVLATKSRHRRCGPGRVRQAMLRRH